MPVNLTVTEFVSKEIVDDLVADLAPYLQVDDVARFGMRSATPPEWIRVAADVLGWTFPFKAAATAYFVKFAQRAADHHWDHRHEIATFLKTQIGRPLAAVSKALARARSRLTSPQASLVFSLTEGSDEMFGPSLSTNSTDEHDIALQLIRFVDLVPSVADVLERHRKSGTGPIGPGNLRFEDDNAVRIEWMDASLQHHSEIVPIRRGA